MLHEKRELLEHLIVANKSPEKLGSRGRAATVYEGRVFGEKRW